MTASERLYTEKLTQEAESLEQGAESAQAALRHLSNSIEELQNAVDSGVLTCVMEDVFWSYIMQLQQVEAAMTEQADCWQRQAKAKADELWEFVEEVRA